jgi:hypothetical protein
VASPSQALLVSQAPHATPTASPTPTTTPTPNIQEVPITRYGDISTDSWGYPPYYTLEVTRAELVAVDPVSAASPTFDFAIAVPTDSGKIESICTSELLGIDGARVVHIPSCNFQGVTIWFQVVAKTYFKGGNGGQGLTGATANLESFAIGSQISDITVEFIKGKVDVLTTAQARENLAVFHKLIADNGKKSQLRADRVYAFFVTQVIF